MFPWGLLRKVSNQPDSVVVDPFNLRLRRRVSRIVPPVSGRKGNVSIGAECWRPVK